MGFNLKQACWYEFASDVWSVVVWFTHRWNSGFLNLYCTFTRMNARWDMVRCTVEKWLGWWNETFDCCSQWHIFQQASLKLCNLLLAHMSRHNMWFDSKRYRTLRTLLPFVGLYLCQLLSRIMYKKKLLANLFYVPQANRKTIPNVYIVIGCHLGEFDFDLQGGMKKVRVRSEVLYV